MHLQSIVTKQLTLRKAANDHSEGASECSVECFPSLSAWPKKSNESSSLHKIRPTVTLKRGNCARLIMLEISTYAYLSYLLHRCLLCYYPTHSQHLCFLRGPQTRAESKLHCLSVKPLLYAEDHHWSGESSLQLRSREPHQFHLKAAHRVLLHLLQTGGNSSFTGFLCCEFVP